MKKQKTKIKDQTQKKILMIMVFAIILIGIPNVSSIDYFFSVNYNPSTGGSHYANSHYDIVYSSVIMQIITSEDSYCKYDIDSGKNYSQMDNDFFYTGGTTHSENLLNLEDGTHFYYVKCNNSNIVTEPEELKIILKINSLISGKIFIDKSEPLSEGELLVTLETSKYALGTPILSYSFDGISYKTFVLEGDGYTFRGPIVLDDSLLEGILSFKLSAKRLDGRSGTEITDGAYFSYDLIRPSTISNINTESMVEKIRLDWHTDEEDIREFKIYRSEFTNVDYTDFYEVSDEDDNFFYDDFLEARKTYYYRVSVIDEAGNEGPLSKEVSGTSLLEEGEIISGLSPSLYGVVEAFMVEINAMKEEIDSIEESFLNKLDKEKYLIEKLGLMTKVESLKRDIVSINANAERLKEQDLDKETLESRINTERLKMSVIERGIPSDLIIIEEKKQVESITDEKKENAIFAVRASIDLSTKDDSIKITNKFLGENKLIVDSLFYEIRVLYLDGSKKEYSAIKRFVGSDFEQMENSYFIENIPESIIENQDDIVVKNSNYNFVGESNVMAFDSDAEDIFYYFPKVTNFRSLNEIEFSFIKIAEDNSKGSLMTGFSVFGEGDGGYYGIIFLVIISLGGIYYFIHSRNSDFSDDYFRMSNKISEAKDFLHENNIKEAKNTYSKIKKYYSSMNKVEKYKLHPKLDALYNDILISELTIGLTRLGETKDIKLFSKLEAIFNSLSEDRKNKISPLFNKIKEDFSGEK